MNRTISLLPLFDAPCESLPEARVACARATRHAWLLDGDTEVVLDVEQEFGVRCVMLRTRGHASGITFELDDCVAIDAVPAGGWLLRRRADVGRCWWLPRAPSLRWLDEHRRIQRDETAQISALNLDGQSARLTLALPDGAVLDAVLWDLPETLAAELTQLESPEGRGLFLWGSHTVYRRPADCWRHLVHGHVYEDRYEWPLRRKTPSENDAHALSVCLDGLANATGKRIYPLLKRHLLLSVLDRQDEDGGYRHGEWTDANESHFRLHASAMHLMMDTLSIGPDVAVLTALERAMRYATAQRDSTALGDWFLHDELELSTAGMDAGPFRWIASSVCGKSPTNMLVLNTHLDTLVALLRYRELTGDRQYDALIESACAAARGVLALRPMEAVYSLLFRLFGLTFLPTHRAAALPLMQRAFKRIAWRWLLPWLPRLKARWPRLVMPGGYVDRDLSLGTWSHRYLSVNTMDLARTARRLPDEPLYRDVLSDALRFATTSGIAEKWREKEADRYSIGFLVESLYQVCTLDAAPAWRALLAEQVLAAHDMNVGLSPSVLGINREIDARGIPVPRAGDPRLIVIVIRGRQHDEVLVINPDRDELPLTWSTTPAGDVTFNTADRANETRAMTVRGRGWWLGSLMPRVQT